MDMANVAVIGAVLVGAGAVKGVIGLGLPAISVGLLGIMMPPVQAAALLVVPNLVTNVFQAWTGPHARALLARLWPMLAGLMVGTIAAGLTVVSTGARWSIALLGVALVAYAGVGLANVRLRVPTSAEIWLGPLVGLTTGVLTAATGVFVMPAVPYIQALGLEKDELVQALGLFFLTATLALAVTLGATGLFDGPVLAGSVLALAPALLGMWMGQGMRRRISQAAFKKAFFVGLLVLGLIQVARGLT